jgi:anti-anti-sigma regulatory factor
MKLSTRGKTLNITLGEACTIIDVEAHAEQIQKLPSSINRIHVNIRSVAELDTAYLQCIYALKKEADEAGIALQTSGKNKIVDHVCRLYGLEKMSAGSGAVKQISKVPDNSL